MSTCSQVCILCVVSYNVAASTDLDSGRLRNGMEADPNREILRNPVVPECEITIDRAALNFMIGVQIYKSALHGI